MTQESEQFRWDETMDAKCYDRHQAEKEERRVKATYDPFGVLGVSRTATTDEVKSAYRRIARETHPDLHGENHSNVRRFTEATEAYAVLSNPKRRAEFERSGAVDDDFVAETRDAIFAAVADLRQTAAAAKEEAFGAALRGLGWLAVGALVSLASYAAAASSPGGGRYTVLVGAIFFGGLQAIRGFVACARISNMASNIEKNLWSGITG
jgi:curved DNA-binding protein CbpA